ncbi:high affinity copper uptake protein 1-like isoform X2 [Prorops nasuta]|uniref:high affinity copper uptake protein 1-like isoform X2 n=1 Tax=Prorops nasuta TaxID=863751 RepID=UPI0034CD2E0D
MNSSDPHAHHHMDNIHSTHEMNSMHGTHEMHGMDHEHMNHELLGAMGSESDSMAMSHLSHTMQMFFHGGYNEVILFESWKTSSIGGLIGSVIGIAIMAALYEGLKYYREYLFWKTYNALQYRSVTVPSEKNVVTEDNRVVQPTMFSWMHTFQTFLHIVQIILSYFLMLIFMTYNVWLCFGVVLGAAIGYFLFGWKKSVIVDVTEHCH